MNRYLGYAQAALESLEELESGCELLIEPRQDDPESFQERKAEEPPEVAFLVPPTDSRG